MLRDGGGGWGHGQLDCGSRRQDQPVDEVVVVRVWGQQGLKDGVVVGGGGVVDRPVVQEAEDGRVAPREGLRAQREGGPSVPDGQCGQGVDRSPNGLDQRPANVLFGPFRRVYFWTLFFCSLLHTSTMSQTITHIHGSSQFFRVSELVSS